MSDEKNIHLGEMVTLSQVMTQLNAEGYVTDFNLPATDNLHMDNLTTHPEHFFIDRYYRFEGESDPEDEAILYAISSVSGDIKGIFVNGYGISSDPVMDDVLNKLKIR
jgi:hypothetical protein